METIYVGEGVYRSAKDTMYYEVFTEEQMGLMRRNKGGFSGIKVIGKKNKYGRIEFENFQHPAITDNQRAIIDWAKEQVEPPLKLSPEQRLDMGLRGTTLYDMSKNFTLKKDDDLPKKIGGGHNDWERMTEDGDVELDEDFMEEVDVKPDGDGKNDTGRSASNGAASGGNKSKKPSTTKPANGKSNKKSS